VRVLSKKMGKEITSAAPSTLEALRSYHWPGNVRELANVIERAVITTTGTVLQISNISETLPATAPHQPSKTLEEVEREYIAAVSEATGGKIEGPDGAAKILGLHPSTLRARMQKLRIQIRRPDPRHGRGEEHERPGVEMQAEQGRPVARITRHDVQQDLVSHNLTDYNQRIDYALPASLLSVGAVNTPQLAENRYLFNQSGVLNLNNLINLKNKLQLRVNAYYVHDKQRQDYSQQTTVFLPGDTVKYSEVQHNRSIPSILHAQFVLNSNRDKYYLNDVLQVDKKNISSYSGLTTDSPAVNQVLKDNTLNFSNEFNLIQTLKSNRIVQAWSYISHSAEPEQLAISPGYNASLFNNNEPYAQLIQNVNIPGWYTNNYFSFRIPAKIFK